MSVTIQGVNIPFSDIDTEETILEKYAIKLNKKIEDPFERVIPAYFRIKDKDFDLKDGVSLSIDDIRTGLKGIPIKDLYAKSISLLKRFYAMGSVRNVAILWIIVNKSLTNVDDLESNKVEEQFLAQIDYSAFSTH